MPRTQAKHITTGKEGESSAVSHILSKGYLLIDRNVRAPWGEIDIVGRSHDGTLVFFEVKTMNDGLLKPEDNLSSAKLFKLKRMCEYLSNKYQGMVRPSKGWRIDLLALTKSGNSYNIKHYENIA